VTTERPKLSVIGTGYLGATHAVCMVELGYEVIGLDVDEVDLTSRALVLTGKGGKQRTVPKLAKAAHGDISTAMARAFSMTANACACSGYGPETSANFPPSNADT